VLSGLSLDYHVLVVNRIRENIRLGMTMQSSVLEGISKTASVVTSAAAVMIVVFAVFGTLSFIELKQMGVGLAIAIFLDATLVRLFALPAALMAGKRVLWRPGRAGVRKHAAWPEAQHQSVMAGRPGHLLRGTGD
jgi:putative drug exporter of the RND superfamily